VQAVTAPAHWNALRRELQLTMAQLGVLKASLPGRVFVGTFAEAARLSTALASADVLSELEQAG
jgi:hypothetical protein